MKLPWIIGSIDDGWVMIKFRDLWFPAKIYILSSELSENLAPLQLKDLPLIRVLFVVT